MCVACPLHALPGPEMSAKSYKGMLCSRAAPTAFALQAGQSSRAEGLCLCTLRLTGGTAPELLVV